MKIIPIVVMLMVVVSGCVTTQDAAPTQMEPKFGLDTGSFEFTTRGGGTYSLLAEVGEAATRDSAGTFRLNTLVRIVGPADTPFIVARFHDFGDGKFTAATVLASVGGPGKNSYFEAFGPIAPRKVLLVFGAELGDWTVTFGALDGRTFREPISNITPVLTSPAPAFAIHDPRLDISSDVKISDTRSGKIGNAYTTGELVYRTELSSPVGFGFASGFASHEGEGRYEIEVKSGKEREVESGTYSRTTAGGGNFQLIRPITADWSVEAAFRPLADPDTRYALWVVAVPMPPSIAPRLSPHDFSWGGAPVEVRPEASGR